MDFDQFEGIVEMDETYFLYSEKGKRKVEGRKARKRGGASSQRGISKEQVYVLVARDRQKLTPANVLCTDAWRAFMTYAKEKGLEHYRFKSDGKERVRGVYHIQNVNSYHSRLKGWINRFNGVATKYLYHLRYWLRFLHQIRHRNGDTTVSKMIVESCLFSTDMTYTKCRLSEFSEQNK